MHRRRMNSPSGGSEIMKAYRFFKTSMMIGLLGIIVFALVWAGSGPRVLPEMQECLQSHGSQEQYAAVLEKYCRVDLIGKAMGLLVVKDPQVVRVEHSGKAVCYLVEGSIADISVLPLNETVEVYSVCWQDGRIASLDFNGGRFMAF
jgi:hypothetical protein